MQTSSGESIKITYDKITVLDWPAYFLEKFFPTLVDFRKIESDFLELMNRQRRQSGLKRLIESPILAVVARERSWEMARENYFSHVSPHGKDYGTLLRIRRVNYVLAAENISCNGLPFTRTSSAAIAGLMQSQGHRENILNPNFVYAGVGLALRKRTKFFTTIFSSSV